ncbi:hypothetical protein M0812_28890 [Anaeramoeba flamelloides]|uniref:Uncharacterized protein n=1 Tax=Anaeramoeba flamelloides TaxID=1746091 RepID=A0AAV7YAC2_9EUKA|nr:hypothetical protein M0812_28890 [Anaeramoeba flamelloides]
MKHSRSSRKRKKFGSEGNKSDKKTDQLKKSKKNMSKKQENFGAKRRLNSTKENQILKRNQNGDVIFDQFPDFRPNLTPHEIFSMGSFGGTYWRPISSSVTEKQYRNQYKKYPTTWWKGIPKENLVTPWDDYNKNVNKYKVKVGTTLEFWESKGWITKYHPYGWVQWYCDFYSGKRGPDDQRQMKRWIRTAGPNSRFRKALINLIKKKKSKWDDFSISPKRRQTLQHWGYILTKKDFEK